MLILFSNYPIQITSTHISDIKVDRALHWPARIPVRLSLNSVRLSYAIKKPRIVLKTADSGVGGQ